MNLSFLIVASHASHCVFEVVDSIERAVGNKYTYEILISSFEEIKYKNTIWIEDKLKREGNTVQAYNNLAKHSTGDYLFVLNDDHMFPDDKPLNVIPYMESDLFKDRKYKVSGIGASPNLNRMYATAIPNLHTFIFETSRLPYPEYFPDELKDIRFCTYNHRYMIVGYPVFARETVMSHFGGYVLNPSFRHHWADNYLPLFIGETDGYPLICEDTPLKWCPRPGVTTNTTNDLYDYKVFCDLAVKLLMEDADLHDQV